MVSQEMRFENPKYKNYIRTADDKDGNPGQLIQTPMQEIYPEIFVYKNFLPESVEKNYLSMIKSSKNWNVHGNYDTGDFGDKFWINKLSEDFNLMHLIVMVTNTITPEFMPFPHLNFIRMLPGDSSRVYCSNYPENVGTHDLNLCVYLGQWTGGELVFPKINFTYNPEPRDLLIFKSDPLYEHYISEVKSGERYSWISYGIKHPGYVPM